MPSKLASLSLLTAVTATSEVWPSQSFVTEDYTPPDMAVSQTGATEPGYLFIAPNGNGTASTAPLIFANDNELVWNGPTNGMVYNDFRVQSINGTPYLSYWSSAPGPDLQRGYGSVTFLNSSYDEVYTVCPQDLNIITPGNVTFPCYLDQHEGVVTSDNTLLATAYNVTRADLTSVGGPSDGWIFDSMFYEIDIATSEILLTWHSLDYPDRIPITESKSPMELDGTVRGSTGSDPWDYFHINSLQKLSDGYLVNSRHLFSTYKVSFNGSIEWHLAGDTGGDFSLGPDIYFSWQHRAKIVATNGSQLSIVYFNNDNSDSQNGTNSTTGLELSVDQTAFTATLLRKVYTPTEPLFADSQGSFDVLSNDHALMGYGELCTTREYDENNNLIYEATYGYSNATSLCSSYRTYRVEWHGQPSTPPKAAASNGSIYVSWNGATEVASWEVYAGSACSDLCAQGAQNKSGFETKLNHKAASGQYVVVEALDVHGHGLANSSCIVAS